MLFRCFVWTFMFVACCSSVIFQDCGSAYDLEEVNISGCGMSLPCYITLGEDTPVSVQFYADFASFKLDQDVVININYVNMAPEVTPEPCAIAACPVPTDCVTSFTSVMSVPRNMALNQRGWLQWRVYNERGILVLCYSVMVQTQNERQKQLREKLGMIGAAIASTVNSTDAYEEAINFNNISLTQLRNASENVFNNDHYGQNSKYVEDNGTIHQIIE